METHRILIHISDRDKWQSAVGLVGAFMERSGDKTLEIIIIADIFAGAVCLHCNQSLKQQMIDLVAFLHTRYTVIRPGK